MRNGMQVYVDPHDATILGERQRGDNVASSIHRFHTNLLIGEPGSKVQGASAAALVLLSMSGLVLWWRQKIAVIRFRVSARRLCYELHSAVGLYDLVFWLVAGTTGTMMTFEHWVEPALYRVAGKIEEPPKLRSASAEGRLPLSIDRIIELSKSRLPGAIVALVSLPKSETDLYTAFMKFPEDRTPAGRSRVYVDQFTGDVLWTTSTRSTPWGSWIWHRHRSWHTGEEWGWPGRLLMGAACVLLIVQVVSGLIWWQRRRLFRSTSPSE